MKLKGDYSSATEYAIGDVVRYTDGIAYHKLAECPAGTEPVDTRYWSRTNQVVNDTVNLILDALEIESGNNSTIAGTIPSNLSDTALLLNSSTEDSTKQFLITVDDDGELTATEVEEEAET